MRRVREAFACALLRRRDIQIPKQASPADTPTVPMRTIVMSAGRGRDASGSGVGSSRDDKEEPLILVL